MFKYRIITTCGISLSQNLNNESKMNDTLFSSLFYELMKRGEDEKKALKEINNLLSRENKDQLINQLKDKGRRCYLEIKEGYNAIEKTDKDKLKEIISKHINMEGLSKEFGFTFDGFKDTILELLREDLNGFNEKIDNYLNTDLKKFIRRKSAECNAMAFYFDEYIGKDFVKEKMDKIYLISSDTDKGEDTAKIIKKFLEVLIEEIYQGDSKDLISIERIKGLATDKPDVFEKEGIREYLTKLFDIRYEDKHKEYKYVVNLTGGYKATIPYTIYFASGFDLDVFYIHEGKNYGIVFPRIPINFGQDMINKLMDIRESLEKGKKIAASEKAKDYNMKSFINEDYTFSEFGNVLIELIQKKIMSEQKLEKKEEKIKSRTLFKKFKK